MIAETVQARTRCVARALSWAAILACALVLPACSSPATGPQQLSDYLTRLSRTLDTPIPAEAGVLEPPRLLTYEIAAADIPASNVGLLDFLALSDCALQVNIGRRNSSLGRHASASQKLLLDLEFLALVPPCIDTLQTQERAELAAELRRIQQDKTAQLPYRIYNAILAGPEFRASWQLPPDLGSYPSRVGGDVVDALGWFESATAAWLSGDYSFSWQPLEEQLFHLRSGDHGALLLAATLQAGELARATAMLSVKAVAGPLCRGQQMNSVATTLDTVTVKFFAGSVQPWLATLDQRERQLMAPLRGLEARLADVLPQPYVDWVMARDGTLGKLRSSPRQHIAGLQNLAASCPDSALHPGTQL